MAETRRKFDADFKEGPVRLVRETGKRLTRGTDRVLPRDPSVDADLDGWRRSHPRSSAGPARFPIGPRR